MRKNSNFVTLFICIWQCLCVPKNPAIRTKISVKIVPIEISVQKASFYCCTERKIKKLQSTVLLETEHP